MAQGRCIKPILFSSICPPWRCACTTSPSRTIIYSQPFHPWWPLAPGSSLSVGFCVCTWTVRVQKWECDSRKVCVCGPMFVLFLLKLEEGWPGVRAIHPAHSSPLVCAAPGRLHPIFYPRCFASLPTFELTNHKNKLFAYFSTLKLAWSFCHLFGLILLKHSKGSIPRAPLWRTQVEHQRRRRSRKNAH